MLMTRAMLSTRQAADLIRERLGIAYEIGSISRLVNQGHFPGAVKGLASNSHWHIPEESVEEFVVKVQAQSAVPA